MDPTDEKIIRALGGNPMADYMGQRAASAGQNRQAAQAAQSWSGAVGTAGLATGNAPAMIGGGFGAMVAQLVKLGYRRQEAEALAAQQMWSNTGLPGRPTE